MTHEIRGPHALCKRVLIEGTSTRERRKFGASAIPFPVDFPVMQCLNVIRVLQEQYGPLGITCSYLSFGLGEKRPVGQTVNCFSSTCGYLFGVVNKVSDLCIEWFALP